MDSGGMDQDDRSVGELFSTLVDQGKAYARAEVGYVKASAEAKADRIKAPAGLLAAALLCVVAGTVVLFMTIALGLATLIGPVAGGAVATLLAFGLAGLLALIARNKLAASK
ncbi:phage holin family protein [Sphingomonas sp. LY160]|uniref:phage holin family protein n=1 Tax=Sphingomonas sp. LY160 TaxID=3095342 RepID=UPI002ADEB755|nr:phage holin family protein [Sphingomonas sp. LY160]MEA1071205.1 phage holin family protein [Sphingomonas sp. LY160]